MCMCFEPGSKVMCTLSSECTVLNFICLHLQYYNKFLYLNFISNITFDTNFSDGEKI